MATIYPTSVPSKRLAASITASSTSIQLSNILGWDAAALTSADFGTKLYAVLRNDSNTVMELMELDPATIADSSITILRRGLKFNGDLTTEVTANKLAWVKNETIVDIGSDTPQLLLSMVNLYNAQTITGAKTFSTVPASTAAPVAGDDLVNKTYADGLVTGAPIGYNKVVVAALAGETVAAGNLVYFDLTDNEWKKCDADTAATVEGVILGIAQGAGTNGNAISGGVLLYGYDTNQSGMTQGDPQYASNTAGGISSSPGTTSKTIGIAYSATALYFDPYFSGILSSDKVAAAAGNSGTPSSTNKFVTQKGLQLGAESYAADAEASDTYVITLSPAPTALADGMKLSFKANTANTGAATLNVNSLGADAILRPDGTALQTGDILANQIVEVQYRNSDWYMMSPFGNLVIYKVINSSRGDSDASGDQTIAHGLGRTPKMVRISAIALKTSGTDAGMGSTGSYDGTTQGCIYYEEPSASYAAAYGQSTTKIVHIKYEAKDQTAAASWDATNLTLTWTKNGASMDGGSIYMVIEIWG